MKIEAPVLSGVPQGTVMGPLLFLIFINDIAKDIKSRITFLADDCLLYYKIKTREDCNILQRDLDTLLKWTKTWGMAFNIKKCNVLSITNKTKNRINNEYQMENQPIKTIDSTPYLGVTITKKLLWNEHIDKAASAANRMLGFLTRTMRRCPQDLKEKAYKTTVRPKLEYCSSIWDPHETKYIKKCEMVQHRAARFVKNIPHRYTGPQPSVTAMVSELGWETLQNRRLNSRLTLLYKVKNSLVEVPTEYHPVPNLKRDPGTRRCHNKQYERITSDVNAFTFAFLPRTIVDWNNLRPSVVAAESLESFKARLSSIQ